MSTNQTWLFLTARGEKKRHFLERARVRLLSPRFNTSHNGRKITACVETAWLPINLNANNDVFFSSLAATLATVESDWIGYITSLCLSLQCYCLVPLQFSLLEQRTVFIKQIVKISQS